MSEQLITKLTTSRCGPAHSALVVHMASEVVTICGASRRGRASGPARDKTKARARSARQSAHMLSLAGPARLADQWPPSSVALHRSGRPWRRPARPASRSPAPTSRLQQLHFRRPGGPGGKGPIPGALRGFPPTLSDSPRRAAPCRRLARLQWGSLYGDRPRPRPCTPPRRNTAAPPKPTRK